MNYYPIRFEFRKVMVNAHVQDFGEYAMVNFTDTDIINDFSGTLKINLPSKKLDPNQFIRNKEAKDLSDLVRAITSKLQ